MDAQLKTPQMLSSHPQAIPLSNLVVQLQALPQPLPLEALLAELPHLVPPLHLVQSPQLPQPLLQRLPFLRLQARSKPALPT